MSHISPVITEAGLQSLFNSRKTGLFAEISHIALGSRSWNPDKTSTTLKDERQRLSLSQGLKIDNKQIYVTAIDDTDAEYTIHEVGLFLSDGTLFAIWSDEEALVEKSSKVDLIFNYTFHLSQSGEDVVVNGDNTFDFPIATHDNPGLVRLAENVTEVNRDNSVITTSVLQKHTDSVKQEIKQDINFKEKTIKHFVEEKEQSLIGYADSKERSLESRINGKESSLKQHVKLREKAVKDDIGLKYGGYGRILNNYSNKNINPLIRHKTFFIESNTNSKIENNKINIPFISEYDRLSNDSYFMVDYNLKFVINGLNVTCNNHRHVRYNYTLNLYLNSIHLGKNGNSSSQIVVRVNEKFILKDLEGLNTLTSSLYRKSNDERKHGSGGVTHHANLVFNAGSFVEISEYVDE